MSPNESAAWIAAGVSTLTAIITYFTTVSTTKKELDRVFATKLQELRLIHYPEAFNITERLGKRLSDTPEEASINWLKAIEELRAWKAGVAALVMSDDSLGCFYRINEAMKANLAKGAFHSEDQIRRIREARDAFRAALRKDIGLKSNQ